MNLHNYYAIAKALELSQPSEKKWEIKKDQIIAINDFFEPYLDYEKLVLIPRFNGNYISFRYCGLEVLQLTKNGKYKINICEKSNQIRGADKPKEIESLNDLRPYLNKIKDYLNRCKANYQEVFKQPKQKRYIPGFSLEHWLESIILSDSPEGKRTRECLGINPDLKKVVSQAPIILIPSKYSKSKKPRDRHHHIDILSFNDDGTVTVVELKKDDDLPKARRELVEYTNWLMERKGEFHLDRGNAEAMMEKGYLPPLAQVDFTFRNTKAVAVVTKHENGFEKLENDLKLKVVNLPDDWLQKKGCIFG